MSIKAASQTHAKISRAAATDRHQFYSHLELRHHLNTYYDQDGFVISQDPTLHTKIQMGLLTNKKKLDLYATFGAVKRTQTQQMVPKRSALAIDYYPIKGANFNLRLYSVGYLPFKKPREDADSPVEREDLYLTDFQKIIDSESTVTSVGANPMFIENYDLTKGQYFKLKASIDIWSYLYSRKQYRKTEPSEEDFAMRMGSLYRLGGEFGMLSQPLRVGVDIYMKRFYFPVYKIAQDRTSYHYKVDRQSYYRIRARYQLADNMSLVNDFYHFHEGIFERKVIGSRRRFRNIARIICSL